MRVMVTGGGGFLGRAVVKLLIEAGYDVSTFSRQRYPEVEAMGAQAFQGDLAENDHRFLDALEGCDAIIHTAAKAGVWGQKKDFFRSNILATQNVLTACQKLGIERLVYTSSPSVVFDGTDHRKANESLPYPRRFLSYYPWSKATAERLVRQNSVSGLKTISLRPHLIWGPGDPHLCPRIIAKARSGRLRLIGSEDKLIDAVYIDNAAYAHLLALKRLDTHPEISGSVSFITNHEPWPLSKIINEILASAGLKPVHKRINEKVAYAAGATLEMIFRLLNADKEPPITRFVARQLATAHHYDPAGSIKLLNYQPIVSMAEGFERLKKSYQIT